MKLLDVNDLQKRTQFQLARLSDNDDFLGLLALVEKGINNGKQYCVELSGEPLTRMQGRVQELQELLQAVNDSKDIATNHGEKILPMKDF